MLLQIAFIDFGLFLLAGNTDMNTSNLYHSEVEDDKPNVPTQHSAFSQYLTAIEHEIVRNGDNKPKLCVVCQANKIKTKSGWKVYSRFHCKTCLVPLCIGERDCYESYHRMLFGDGVAPLSGVRTEHAQKLHHASSLQ